MELLNNFGSITSNLCNDTVIPVYIVDNVEEFTRKAKPFHVIDVKNGSLHQYSAINREVSSKLTNTTTDNNDINEKVDVALASEKELEFTSHEVPEHKNDNVQTYLLHDNELHTITTKKEEVKLPFFDRDDVEYWQQQQQQQQKVKSHLFQVDCCGSTNSINARETSKAKSFEIYVPDDEDMNWCDVHNVNIALFQNVITAFDKIYATTILSSVYNDEDKTIFLNNNDSNKSYIDNEKLDHVESSNQEAYMGKQCNNKCDEHINNLLAMKRECIHHCSVCGAAVHVANTNITECLEELREVSDNTITTTNLNNNRSNTCNSTLKEENNYSNNVLHRLGLRCSSCNCVAHLFCWGESEYNRFESNWKCNPCKYKEMINIATIRNDKNTTTIVSNNYNKYEKNRMNNRSKHVRPEAEMRCVFCGKDCQYGAMFRFIPYERTSTWNKINYKHHHHHYSNTERNKGTKKIRESNVSVESTATLPDILSNTTFLPLLELSSSNKGKHPLPLPLWCHAVCGLTSQIVSPTFMIYKSNEKQESPRAVSSNERYSQGKRKRVSHTTTRYSAIHTSNKQLKVGTLKENAMLSGKELVFIAHKRFTRSRLTNSLECCYCHSNEGWRVRCAHARCFNVLHPLCAAEAHGVECISESAEPCRCQTSFYVTSTTKNDRSNNNISSSSSSNNSSINKIIELYWVRCNVYCVEHAHYYISSKFSLCHLEQHHYPYLNLHHDKNDNNSISTEKVQSTMCRKRERHEAESTEQRSSCITSDTTCNKQNTKHELTYLEPNALAEAAVMRYAAVMHFSIPIREHTSNNNNNDNDDNNCETETRTQERKQSLLPTQISETSSSSSSSLTSSLCKVAEVNNTPSTEVEVFHKLLLNYWMCKRAQRQRESEQWSHEINITHSRAIGTVAFRPELVKITQERVTLSSFLCLTPYWQQRLIMEVEEFLPLPDEEYETLRNKMRPRKRALTRRAQDPQERFKRLSTVKTFMHNLYNMSELLHKSCVQRQRCVRAELQEIQWRLSHCLELL